MAYTAENVQLGEGTLSVRVFPDGPWTDVGAMLGGELTYTPEFKHIECGEVMAAITTIMIGEEGELKVNMLESTSRNLAIAGGMNPDTDITGTAVSPEYIEFGDKHDPVFYNIKYTQPQTADTTKNFVYNIFKCMAAGSGLSIAFAKKDEQVIEVTFKMFANSDASVGTLNKMWSLSREY